MIKNKILWKKPDYRNEWARVSNKEIDRYCINNTSGGDIKIEREQYGRKIRFKVFRIEKVGELIEGIETLSRQRAIEELKKCQKESLNAQEKGK
jgi:hypothetical protein